jgi:hypothetical protein
VNRSPDELLSVTQMVAELQHKLTGQTVSTWCRTGKLRARRIGLKWFVRRADFESFVNLNEGGEEGEKEVKTNALAA